MKKLITLFSLLAFVSIGLQAQVLFSENFENGTVPTGWTIQSSATDGGWKVGTAASLSSQSFGIASNGSSRIAATNDDVCNCNKSNEYFITPPIDLSNETAVVLKFDAFYNDNSYQGVQENATIEISTDSLNWEVIEDLHGHGSWDRHTVNLTDYAGADKLYIGFRYDDGGGWLYGFAIDNITVEVSPLLDVELAELNNRLYGEVGNEIPISGTVFNAGANVITSLEIDYTVNGGNPVSETIDNLSIEPFTYHHFEMTGTWIPDTEGDYTIEATIVSANGQQDENQDNNNGSFDTQIYAPVSVPNKMQEFLETHPDINVVAGASGWLNSPTDLDFFPILGKDELWVVNQRTENEGGSTLTIADATQETPSDFLHRVDGNAWHFMSLPTGIAFSPDNYNFGTSPGVQDANHNGGTFTGPALWSSDPDIYAQPSGGNGSHLDMLHGSPFSMGIAHEVDNVFWVYDNWNKDIVRYDFVEDHGPGNADHDDGIVHRYKGIGINADTNIPNHMVLDKTTGWMYFVDNGNDRVIRLDINSGSGSNNLPLINEALAEHAQIIGFNWEVIIDSGLDRPCGIEIFENRLLVGDYATGDIILYDMDNNFEELGRIPTENTGLTGIKVGPDGNIWCTNRIQNQLFSIQPGELNSVRDLQNELHINVSPNPVTDVLNINIPQLDFNAEAFISLTTTTGKEVLRRENITKTEQLNLAELPNGIYFLNLHGGNFYGIKKIIVNR